MGSSLATVGFAATDVLAEPLPLVGGGGFIELAVLFFVLAIVAAIVGARGVAGVSMTIAKWMIIIFVVLAVVSLLL
ncbi:DUF1328 family protein [Halobacterium yunchengense]|uniref:DUF1328 family protein n=1 Tax=Halobacterium yunchengense TaxID=3108497 RepID=UPI00300AEEA4